MISLFIVIYGSFFLLFYLRLAIVYAKRELFSNKVPFASPARRDRGDVQQSLVKGAWGL
jgi:hypothetical protein